ncbi:hypothetical protein B6259_00365 [Ruminococcaceae bacterium CPB6]|nr:hypothetical protein B6259_00365 [Ruminococcaceae bacterium CPB6]
MAGTVQPILSLRRYSCVFWPFCPFPFFMSSVACPQKMAYNIGIIGFCIRTLCGCFVVLQTKDLKSKGVPL